MMISASVKTLGKVSAILAAFSLGFASGPTLALSDPIITTISEDGEHITLTQSTVIDAPVAEVWAAFTTEEGYTSWAVSNARIDMRIGGMMESSYASEFTIDDPDNIKNQIIAFVPERLLVLKNVQAPAGFASRETMDKLTSVFEFEGLSEGKTKVTVHGIGYGPDEESKKLIEFFSVGNAWSFEQLQKFVTDDRFNKIVDEIED